MMFFVSFSLMTVDDEQNNRVIALTKDPSNISESTRLSFYETYCFYYEFVFMTH